MIILYKIEFLKDARDELNKIDPIWKRRIISKLKILAENPESLKNNIKTLKGKLTNYNRLRVGNYRIVYSVENDKMIILIVRVGHRKEVY